MPVSIRQLELHGGGSGKGFNGLAQFVPTRPGPC
jgi:hypothetical protein